MEYLFTPGRFSNAAIQKALQVSRKAFGAPPVHLPRSSDVRQQDSLAGINLISTAYWPVRGHWSKLGGAKLAEALSTQPYFSHTFTPQING